jgi:RNA polymerase sigma factor (sigma-70 family)
MKGPEERGGGVTEAADAAGPDEPLSFVEFFVLGQPRMCSVLRSLTGNDPRVEDALQEAFMTARHRWDDVGCYARPDAWVIKVALRILNGWRRRDRAALPGLDDEADERAARAFEQVERVIDLASALRTLPPARRRVVTLHYRLDLSVEEVADVLDMPVGTVKSHLHHARRRLAALFADEEGTDQ